MAKTKTTTKAAVSARHDSTAFDGAYLLKLVLYVLLGSLWLKLKAGGADFSIPLPIGLVVGLIFTSHEHFQIDRKIEYAALVIATLFGLIAPYGLFISL
jgi:uncharacterized transporter YbjL